MKDKIELNNRQLLTFYLLIIFLSIIMPQLLTSSYYLVFGFTIVLVLIFFIFKINIKIIISIIVCILIGCIPSYLNKSLQMKLEVNSKAIITEYASKNILAEVISKPDKQDGIVKFIVKPQVKQKDIPLIQVSSSFLKKIYIGDLVEVSGKLQLPQNQDDSTFDYVKFLAKDQVYLVINNAIITKHLINNKFNIYKSLANLNDYLSNQISKLWAYDKGGLIAGILIGGKSGLSKSLQDSFRITGLSHIVAISGFNITVVIIFVFGLLSPFSKNTKITVAIIFIVLFTLFVGASAAVVRASIMGIVGLIALYFERQSIVINTLLLSCVLMSIINPLSLFYDIGFQLSFLAVVGLIYGKKVFDKIEKYIPQVFGIREALLLTLSAQITTLPIILYYFGNLSIISPIANVLVTPFIPMAMLFSFITLIISFIPFLNFFTIIFKTITEIIINLSIFITTSLSQIPNASVQVKFLNSIWLLIGLYLLIGWWLWKVHSKKF